MRDDACRVGSVTKKSQLSAVSRQPSAVSQKAVVGKEVAPTRKMGPDGPILLCLFRCYACAGSGLGELSMITG